MSSMQELMEQMKARKASLSNPAPVANIKADTTSSSVMDKLDKVVDKPIDYIGETIDSSPHVLNPTTEVEIIKTRIVRLSDALEKEIPEYASILHTIHKALSKDDELTHLLSDEEIGVLIKAMKHRKNVVLVEEKSKKSAKKALKDTTLDDIL